MNFKKTFFKTNKILTIFLSLLLCATLLCGCSITRTMHREDLTDSTAEQTQGTGGEDPSRPRKRVALTYDDGPHNVRTKLIVDELNKYGYHATFFVLGNRVDGVEYSGGEAMLYAMEAGNEIAIHGYTHMVYYDECSEAEYKQELELTAEAIREMAGDPDYPIRLMRPIGGAITANRVSACPYSVIMWSVDSEDWRYRYSSGDDDEVCAQKVDTIVNNALSGLEDGDIILMHDIYESTYDATVILLARLHEMGYDVVTVSELLGEDLRPGEKYSRVVEAKG